MKKSLSLSAVLMALMLFGTVLSLSAQRIPVGKSLVDFRSVGHRDKVQKPVMPMKKPADVLMATTNARFYAMVTQSEASDDSGIAEINTADGTIEWVWTVDAGSTAAVDWYNAPVYYANDGTVRSITATLYSRHPALVSHAIYQVFDLMTGESLKLFDCMHNEVPTQYAMTIAKDPTDDTIYGIFEDSPYGNLGTITYFPVGYTEGTRQRYPPRGETAFVMDRMFINITFDDKGQLYGLCTDGSLYRIDKTTGAIELVGPTGIYYVNEQGAFGQNASCYDPVTGLIYWFCHVPEPNPYVAGSTTTSSIYEIDPKTGKSQRVCIMRGNEVVDMLLLKDSGATDEAAPAQVGDLSITVGDKTLNDVTFSFSLPATDASGNALSGQMGYCVKEGADVVAEGQADGQRVNVEVKGLATGMHTFSVMATNGAGMGQPSVRKVYVGKDAFAAPDDVEMSMADDQVELTWTPVETSLNGGSLGAGSELAYRVVRMPEEVVVADGLTDGYFSETIDVENLRYVYYKVYPVNKANAALTADADVVGRPGESNKIKVGKYLVLPRKFTFEEETDYDMFTKIITLPSEIPAGFKENKFLWYTSEVFELWSAAWLSDQRGTYINEDYLVTPPMKLRAGDVYNLNFRLYTGMWTYSYEAWLWTAQSCYEVLLTDTPDPRDADVTYVVTPRREFSSGHIDVRDNAVTFAVEEDGLYYLSIHPIKICASASETIMQFDDIEIGVETIGESPAAPTDMVLTPGEKGELKATVSFRVPTKTASGYDLENITKAEISRDGELLQTFDSPQVGEVLTFVDTTPEAGNHRYEARAYNEFGQGARLMERIWLGIDNPQGPKGSRILDNHDGTMTVKSPTECPAEGMHGGYVDPATTAFDVWGWRESLTIANETEVYVEKSADGVSEIKLTGYASEINSKTPDLFYRLAGRSNEAGRSDLYYTNDFITGRPIQPPFDCHFEGAQHNDYFYVYLPQNGSLTWWDEDADGLGRSLSFAFNVGNDWASLNSWKLDLSQMKNPAVRFAHLGIPGDDVKLVVQVDNQSSMEGPKSLYTIDYTTIDGDFEWRYATVDLSQFKDEHYVSIIFRIEVGDVDGSGVVFDDISVFNQEEQGISDVNADSQSTGRKAIFSLDGRRVNTLPQHGHGVYVVNGKKMVK